MWFFPSWIHSNQCPAALVCVTGCSTLVHCLRSCLMPAKVALLQTVVERNQPQKLAVQQQQGAQARLQPTLLRDLRQHLYTAAAFLKSLAQCGPICALPILSRCPALSTLPSSRARVQHQVCCSIAVICGASGPLNTDQGLVLIKQRVALGVKPASWLASHLISQPPTVHPHIG